MRRDVLTPTVPFRLPASGRAVGSFARGGHRSGWPYVMDRLHALQQEGGILLDDFVERTFSPQRRAPTWRERLFPTADTPPTWAEPWVGIFHHPHHLPTWLNASQHPEAVFATPRFRKSRPYLRGAVALSDYLASWLRETLQVPAVAIKHPTEFPVARFSWDAFLANPKKQLVQVGWYLRNYRAIYQVRVPEPFRKVHLIQTKPFVLEAHARTDAYSPYRHRPDWGHVDVVPWLDDDAYDRLFTENVIFLELFDASANNAVIEAIARETPIVVNRHPAVVEYLGDGYPLFYDALDEVKALLTESRLQAAHAYLRALDKHALHLDAFVASLSQFVRHVAAGVHP